MNKHLGAIRKASVGSLFTPTKAMSRVRAIATDRTRASLTGGCFEPGIIRICTEFLRGGTRARPAGAAGSGNVRFRRPRGYNPHKTRWRGMTAEASRSIAVGGRRRSDPHPFLLRNRRPLQMRKRQTELSRISRFARRGAHATVREVLTRAIAASQHWRIIRSWAAQHF
jgi:hypothetical protein